MRKLFGKIHRWISIPLGIILSVICFSGATLVFEKEITQWLNPHIYKVSIPEKGTALLTPSELIACLKTQVADSLRLSALQYGGAADEPVMVTFQNVSRKSLSVNPYTGEVNGWTPSYPFFQTMRKLHRWLLNPPLQKGTYSAGKVIVGISTLLMVVILVSGLVIWWPRSRKALCNRLQVSCTKGWRRFWYDSHVALGFYSTLFLLVMALTGLTWSFGWYRSFAYGLFGATPSSSASPHHHGTPQEAPSTRAKGKNKTNIDYKVWDEAFQKVQAQYSGYASLRIEKNKIQVNQSRYLRRTDTVEFNPANGEPTRIIPSTETPRSQKLRSWFYAFHTGSWGGIYTKVLYFLAAFIGGVLPLSGYYLWWKKRRKSTR
ncbi:putative uncharacterized protein [Bacteroides sp. CAG:875]|nr:putative uncharacterized protein [Bacteroides sp. CAG:875]